MTTRKTLCSFQVLDEALLSIQQLRSVVLAIKNHDADLTNQIQRAASSIALNLAEGNGSSSGNRRKHFSYALGSTRELRAALQVAQAWGYIADVKHIDSRLDRIGAMTWTLMKRVE